MCASGEGESGVLEQLAHLIRQPPAPGFAPACALLFGGDLLLAACDVGLLLDRANGLAERPSQGDFVLRAGANVARQIDHRHGISIPTPADYRIAVVAWRVQVNATPGVDGQHTERLRVVVVHIIVREDCRQRILILLWERRKGDASAEALYGVRRKRWVEPDGLQQLTQALRYDLSYSAPGGVESRQQEGVVLSQIEVDGLLPRQLESFLDLAAPVLERLDPAFAFLAGPRLSLAQGGRRSLRDARAEQIVAAPGSAARAAEGAVGHPGELGHEVAKSGRIIGTQEQVHAEAPVLVVVGPEADRDTGLLRHVGEEIGERDAGPPAGDEFVEARVVLLSPRPRLACLPGVERPAARPLARWHQPSRGLGRSTCRH